MGNARGNGGVTVQAATTVVLSECEYRKRVLFVNDSANNIYLAKGFAVAAEGLRLNANGGSYEDLPDIKGYIYKGAYTAIAPAGASTLTFIEE